MCRIAIRNLIGLGGGLGGLRAQIDRVKRASVSCTITAPAAGLPQVEAAFAAGLGVVAVRGRPLLLRIDV